VKFSRFVALLTILAACCVSSVAAQAEQVTISIMSHLLGPDGGWIGESIEADFLPHHPNINVEYLESGGWATIIEQVPVRHAGGVAPDLFMITEGETTITLAKEFGLDLTPYLARDNVDTSVWFPGALDAFHFEGKQLGLPHHINPELHFYNKMVFASHGFEDPLAYAARGEWTWDRVEKIGRTITRDVDGDGEPDIFALASGGWSVMWFEVLQQFGGDVIRNNRLVLEEPNAQAALEFLAASNFQNGGWWYTGPEASDKFFVRNEAALRPLGYWILNTYSPAEHPYDLAPKPIVSAHRVPEGSGTGSQAAILGTHGFVVSRQTEHPAEAYELAKFLATVHQKDVATHLVPVTRDAILSDTFIQRHPEINVEVLLSTSNAAAPKPHSYTMAPLEVRQMIEQAVAQIITGEKVASAAIAEITDAVNAILSSR